MESATLGAPCGRIGSGAVVLVFLLCQVARLAPADTIVERGEYLVRAAGCVACHSDIDNDGAYLAGGRAIETPFGTFYSPNITSDSTHGIGAWNEQQLVNALTRGEGPDSTLR